MIVKNNNTKVIKKLTRRALKSNKTRNIILCLAIIVTMFMIYTVTTVFYSFSINSNIMWTRISGTIGNIALNNPTDTQINTLKEYDKIENQGVIIKAGVVIEDNLIELNKIINLVYNDEEYFQSLYYPSISDIVGAYPTKSDEIMVSRNTLDFLGYNVDDVKLLDTIELSYKIDDVDYTSEFKIVGLYTDYILRSSTTTLVSEDFINNHGLTKEENGTLIMRAKNIDRYKVSNYLNKSFPLNNDQSFNYSFDVQSADEVFGSVIIGGILSLLFVLSGFLLIYNIMYISVVRDINFYGLLKLIGTSPKQIKKIVRNQVYILSIIGIPVGMVLSSILVYKILPAGLSGIVSKDVQHALPLDVYFNPFIFVLSTLFVFLTIQLSCRKPAKIASKISPVEATKFIKTGNNIKKKNKKSTKGGKIYKMAWYNIFRDKKKTILTFLSLFLGIITYLSVVTMLDGLNINYYIEQRFPYDFEIYVKNFYDEDNENFITDEFIENILTLEGVTEVEKLNTGILEFQLNEEFLEPIKLKLRYIYDDNEVDEKTIEYYEKIKAESDFIETRFIGLSDNLAEKLYKESEHKFDLKGFKNGTIGLINKKSYNNEDVTLKNQLVVNGKNQTKKFDLELVDGYNYIQVSGVNNNMPIFIISENALRELADKVLYREIYVNYKKDYTEDYQQLFRDIVEKNNFGLTSRLQVAKSFNESTTIMTTIGGFISFILIFTGLLNFVNLIITSLYSRQREFALLESIGMTKKQISKLIVYEALYYSAITGVLVLTIGQVIIYGVGMMIEGLYTYSVFQLPVVEIYTIIIISIIVSLLTTKIVYKILYKKTIIERLSNF